MSAMRFMSLTMFFSGGNAPVPYLAGDVNCDTKVNVSDAVYVINYVFFRRGTHPVIQTGMASANAAHKHF